MNAKKILSQAFKTVPDNYVDKYARIFIRGKEGNELSKHAVLIAHPTLQTIIWTKEKGWENLHEEEKKVEEGENNEQT